MCVTIQYPPHHLGGYEISCRDVMTRLVDRGHRVTVLTGDMRLPGVSDPVGERTGKPDGVRVRRDLRLYLRGTEPWSPAPWVRAAIERDNQRALHQALDECRPDVVSVWHLGAVSLGLLTTLVADGPPLVYSVCDDWPSYGPELDAWSRLFRDRPLAARLAERAFGVPTRLPDVGRSGSFCFVSETTRGRNEALSPWTFPDWTVVYSGIDLTVFNTDAGFNTDAVFNTDAGFNTTAGPGREWSGRLLYVGRYDRRKGLETVLAALPLLPGATLEIVARGDPAYRGVLEGRASELGVAERVDFATADGAELVARYRSADVVVFPSEWAEPFGLVPVEAMACGTPVVATGVGGSGEFLVDGANCVLFRAGDPEDLAAAVRRIEASPDLHAELVRAGLRTAADLSVERLTDEFEAWHHAAAARFAGGRPPVRRLSVQSPQHAASRPAPSSVSLPPASPVEEAVAGELGGIRGLVLDAGLGPSAAVARLVAGEGRPVVAVDPMMPNVRTVEGCRSSVFGVVADLQRLPFRGQAFSAVACHQLERIRDDAAAVAELARVARPGAKVVLAATNRNNLLFLLRRLQDVLHGTRRSRRAYLLMAGRRRDYTSPQLRRLAARDLRAARPRSVGWTGGPRQRLLSRALRWPGLARLGSAFVVVAWSPGSPPRPTVS